MGFKESSRVGAAALALFAKKLFEDKDLVLQSCEGTLKDKRDGVDYELYDVEGVKVREGAHRHWKGDFYDKENPKNSYIALRYQRYTRRDTDFQKLFDKLENFLYSFSYGNLRAEMPIIVTSARALQSWVRETQLKSSLDNYTCSPFHDGNLFLRIPVKELNDVRFL